MTKLHKNKGLAIRAANVVAGNIVGFTPKAIDARETPEGWVAEITLETTWDRMVDKDAGNQDVTNDERVTFIFAPRERSTVAKPCALVWDLAQKIIVADKGQRKDVIAAAVEQGVNKYTARTQYQRWYEAYHAS